MGPVQAVMMGPWAHHLWSTHAHIYTHLDMHTKLGILQCYLDYCICKVQTLSRIKLSEPWILLWQSKFWNMTTSTWVQGSCLFHYCAEMTAEVFGHSKHNNFTNHSDRIPLRHRGKIRERRATILISSEMTTTFSTSTGAQEPRYTKSAWKSTCTHPQSRAKVSLHS